MKVALLLYPDVEPIDLATIGVISMGKRVIPELSYVTVAATTAPVRLANGLRVLPDLALNEAVDTAVDVLVVPGGPGWQLAAKDAALLAFVQKLPESCLKVSVCTGGMILAAAGCLDGRSATTKREVIEPEESPLALMAARYPAIKVHHALLVDQGQVLTGGGVSLCIDAMLHLIERRFGTDKAGAIARILEYSAARSANQSRLPVVVETTAD